MSREERWMGLRLVWVGKGACQGKEFGGQGTREEVKTGHNAITDEDFYDIVFFARKIKGDEDRSREISKSWQDNLHHAALC
ncbi:hypothetical protein ACOMHN_018226 [Nucella lapillus]